MGLLIKNGDYAAENGKVAASRGGEGLLSEVLFRLTARRGGFPLIPELGSRLYLLGGERPSRRECAARQYAEEALAGLEGLRVTGAKVAPLEGGLRVEVELDWRGEPLLVECEV